MRKALSLYTGAGGLDLGFEAAGFETAVAVEIDLGGGDDATHQSPLAGDRSGHPLGHPRRFSPTAGLIEGEADVLIGGPPCQPFSKSGYWASERHKAA